MNWHYLVLTLGLIGFQLLLVVGELAFVIAKIVRLGVSL